MRAIIRIERYDTAYSRLRRRFRDEQSFAFLLQAPTRVTFGPHGPQTRTQSPTSTWITQLIGRVGPRSPIRRKEKSGRFRASARSSTAITLSITSAPTFAERTYPRTGQWPPYGRTGVKELGVDLDRQLDLDRSVEWQRRYTHRRTRMPACIAEDVFK